MYGVLHSGVGRGRGFPARLLGLITLLIRRRERRTGLSVETSATAKKAQHKMEQAD